MSSYSEARLVSVDGTRLPVRALCPSAPPKAFVGIAHGYGDHSGRYAHTMEALAERGFASLAFDFRGHGRADGRRADADPWGRYVEDLRAFWAHVRAEAGPVPTFLLGHSHGGLVATHFALERPPGLAGLVLSAPFFALAFEPSWWKVAAATVLLRVWPDLHLASEVRLPMLSRDEAWLRATEADELYLRVVTPRWFFGAAEAQRALAGCGPGLSVPLLVVAGLADEIASVDATRAFFATVGAPDKALLAYEGMRHEVLNEQGRERVVDDISRWISLHC